jgi:hypothetical protein
MGQSVYFLIKAVRHSKVLGMDQGKIRKTIVTAAVFTIAPAVAIVISVLALSKSLGLALPWLRLSVVGSMSYETIAASNALQAMGKALGVGELNAQDFANVLIIMTISIMAGLLLVPIIGKKLQTGMANLGKRDAAWAEIFQNALFIGMIAAFLGFVFCDVSMLWNPVAGINPTAGLVPVAVMGVAAAIMVVLGLAMKKWKWLGDYALPISLVLGMISAIPITAWLG